MNDQSIENKLNKKLTTILDSFIDNLGNGGMDTSYSGTAVDSSIETAIREIKIAMIETLKDIYKN